MLPGLSSLIMNMFLATDLTHVGPPTDTIESSRIEWIPLTAVPAMARRGEIVEGVSLTGLMYYLATRSDA